MRPLEGYRVLEFAAYISAPLAAKLLADLGADVIKVEPYSGDPARRWGGLTGDSPWFRAYNASKRSIRLPRDPAEARAVVRSLLPTGDVVITNLAEETLHSTGITSEEVHAANPSTVFLRIYGDTTGGEPVAAFDSVAQAATGLMGWKECPDVFPFPICDTTAAHLAVIQILAVLLAAKAGKRRITLGVSLTEAGAFHTIEALTLYRSLGLKPSPAQRSALSQTYITPTEEGDFVLAHLSSSSRAWSGFLAALKLPEVYRALSMAQRVTEFTAIRAAAAAKTQQMSSAALLELYKIHRVPHSVVRSIETFSNLVSTGLRGMQDLGSVVSATIPMATNPAGSAPLLGQDTEAILDALSNERK